MFELLVFVLVILEILQALVGVTSWDKYSHIYVIFLHSESLFAQSMKTFMLD